MDRTSAFVAKFSWTIQTAEPGHFHEENAQQQKNINNNQDKRSLLSLWWGLQIVVEKVRQWQMPVR